MTQEEIEEKLADYSEVPIRYNGETIIITAYRVDEKKGRVFIYTDTGGLPMERKTDDMGQFFKDCYKLNSTESLLRDTLKESGEEASEKFDIPENPYREEIEGAPVVEKIPIVVKNAVALKEAEDLKATFKDLKTVLMESINKVRADADYIPQANSIKGNVDTLINMAKVQLQLMNSKEKYR